MLPLVCVLIVVVPAMAQHVLPVFNHIELLSLNQSRRLVTPVSAGGRVYLAGGCSASLCDPNKPTSLLKTVEMFDFSESPTKHTVLADLAHNRAGITPVSTEDGYLVLYGGAGTIPPLSSCADYNYFEYYNLSATLSSTQVPPPPIAPSQNGGAGVVVGNFAFFSGGQTCGQQNTYRRAVFAYNVHTKQFVSSPGANLKVALPYSGRASLSALTNGTHVIFAGGQQASTPAAACNYVDLFSVNLTSGFVKSVSVLALSAARYSMSAVRAAGLWVFSGGYGNTGAASVIVDIFDQSLNLLTRQTSPRASLSAAVSFLDRYLLITGGCNKTCLDFLDLGFVPLGAFSTITIGGLAVTDGVPAVSIQSGGISTDLALFAQPAANSAFSTMSVVQISFPTPSPSTSPPPTTLTVTPASPQPLASPTPSMNPSPATEPPHLCEAPQPPTAQCVGDIWVVTGTFALSSPLHIGNTPILITENMIQNGYTIEMHVKDLNARWLSVDPKDRQSFESGITVLGTVDYTAAVVVVLEVPLNGTLVDMHLVESREVIGKQAVQILSAYKSGCETYDSQPFYGSSLSVLVSSRKCQSKRRWMPAVIAVSVTVGLAIIVVLVLVFIIPRTALWVRFRTSGNTGDSYGLLR